MLNNFHYPSASHFSRFKNFEFLKISGSLRTISLLSFKVKEFAESQRMRIEYNDDILYITHIYFIGKPLHFKGFKKLILLISFLASGITEKVEKQNLYQCTVPITIDQIELALIAWGIRWLTQMASSSDYY